VISRSRLAGYLFALCAGILWGTTGPLSTALYAEGAKLTAVGFWRILLSVAGLAIFGLTRPGFFKVDRRGILLVGLLGGALVATFEVGLQFAIAGLGVAPAVTLLYTAPIVVALLAHPLLGEAITKSRVVIAVAVLIGVWLTLTGTVDDGSGDGAANTAPPFVLALAWGTLAALSYAGTTLMARYAVPRYGAVKVLFLELLGGTALLGLLLPLTGNAPAPAQTLAGWIYIVALGIGTVLAANFFFFAGVRRIDAAPTAVAASIEPVVGALLALILFGQQLTGAGWIGLLMVVGGVATSSLLEAKTPAEREPVTVGT